MKLNSIVAFLHAAHWSYLVDGKWDERGGIMLSAPPGSFKTAIIKSLDKHDRALIMADINVPTIMHLRDDVAYGKYRTLAFTEFEKLYQRDPGTASNIEGHLRAFVDEGFKSPSFRDQRMYVKEAGCMVIGAMTPNCYQKNFTRWDDSGFGRRFLWVHYSLKNPGIITEAIHRWERVRFRAFVALSFGENETLPYNLTEKESSELRRMLPNDANTSYTLLKKIACVLKHAQGEQGMDTIRDVAPAFDNGAQLIIKGEYERDKPHHGKTTRREVRGSGVRRNPRATSKTSSKKVRVSRLENKRELSTLPENGVGNDRNPEKEG